QMKPRMRLSIGYYTELIASPEHLIPVWRNNYGESIREKPVEALASESTRTQTYALHVDIAPYLSGTYQEIDIPQLLQEQGIRAAEHAESFPARLRLTAEWGFLIGMYLAEGNMNKRSQVRFSLHGKEADIAERLERLLEPYGVPVSRHHNSPTSMA